MNCLPVTSNGKECAELASSDYIDPERVVKGTAVEAAHIFHTDGSGQMVTGVWECSPCTERVDGYPFDEFVSVIEGSVVLTAPEGSEQTFSAGDSFVMPKGWQGIWHMPTQFKKLFVFIDVAKP